AVGFGGESDLRKLGLCGIHPLTRRYVNTVNSEQLRENNNDRFYSW
ncbi:GNAT family N-acetyltransferase, partial [Vibrio vulnificus]